MNETAKDYVNRIKKEGHAFVLFRYPGHGDTYLPIEKFNEVYGDREVSINGDFKDDQGYIIQGFIRGTS